MADNENHPNDDAADNAAQQFNIQKIYVKDVSFETPHTPAVFREKGELQLNMELNTQARGLDQGVYEVVLSITVTTTINDKTAYLVELQQAGIFGINGMEEEKLSAVLGSYCPNILFPFAREAISDLITRGGFPQMLLEPVNFDALFAQHMQQQQAKQDEAKGQDKPVH